MHFGLRPSDGYVRSFHLTAPGCINEIITVRRDVTNISNYRTTTGALRKLWFENNSGTPVWYTTDASSARAKVYFTRIARRHKKTWSHGVMVSTLDSESSDPSSNLGGTLGFFFLLVFFQFPIRVCNGSNLGKNKKFVFFLSDLNRLAERSRCNTSL